MASTKNNEWLGTGVYFWGNKEDANWWKNCIKDVDREDTEILEVELTCEDEHYRDLDQDAHFEEYTRICSELYSRSKIDLSFSSKAQERNFCCNYYKRLLKLKLLSYRFPVRNQFNYGFEKKALQYCLSELAEDDTIKQQDMVKIKGVKDYVR